MSKIKVLLTLAALALPLIPCGYSKNNLANYPHYSGGKYYRASYNKTNYYYTHYHYGAEKHQYHHVYYYPKYGRQHVYYYNYKKGVYWGRYDYKAKKYSLLAEKDRSGDLQNLVDKNPFPEPVELEKVKIPDTDLNLTTPPDLPSDE